MRDHLWSVDWVRIKSWISGIRLIVRSAPGNTTFPIWFLIIGAECLVDRQSQKELLSILQRMLTSNPARVQHIKDELRKVWDRTCLYSRQRSQPRTDDADPRHSALDMVTTPNRSRSGAELMNPIMLHTDFSYGFHPSFDTYVPPRHGLNGTETTSM